MYEGHFRFEYFRQHINVQRFQCDTLKEVYLAWKECPFDVNTVRLGDKEFSRSEWIDLVRLGIVPSN